jgi:hypothetical protein
MAFAMKQDGTRSRDSQQIPWGRAIGLLAACLATLVGVQCGLEPDVILWRALIAGIAAGFLTATLHAAWLTWGPAQHNRARRETRDRQS